MKKIIVYVLALILLIGSYPVGTYAEGENTNNSNVKLIVRANQTVQLGDGEAASIGVTIENPTDSKIETLTAKATIENPDKVYIDGDGNLFRGAKDLSDIKSASGEFRIYADRDFVSKTVPIKIEMNFYLNNQLLTQTETIYVRVNAPEKPQNPAIEISKVDSLWLDSVEPGVEFQVPFEVKNTGDATAKNIKLELDGLKNEEITLAKGLSTIDITNLNPGESKFVYYNLTSNRKIKGGSYLLNLKYTINNEGGKAPTTGQYSFNIKMLEFKVNPSTLEFKNVTFPKGNIGRNQTATISFDLVNTGKFAAKDVYVTATPQTTDAIASKSVSKIITDVIGVGESKHYSFDFIVSPSAATNNYPIELKASFIDDSTPDRQETTQIAGIFVKAPKESAEKDQGPVPKLIIEEYSFEPSIIEAGKPFKMYLRLYNTNAKKAVKNIKIFLTSDVQESANNQGTQGGGGAAASSSASVFTPIGSSNTFYVPSISAGAKVDKEITLTTVPDTAAKTYTIVANFEYEDANSNKYSATEQIGVPVVQQAKLDVGEILPQAEFAVGTETPISVDFYNTGKATLYNVLVKITGKGLKFDTPTYYKGNFGTGSSDQFSVNVTPEEAGHKKFEITFTFEDSTGQTQTETREYEFNVEDYSIPEDINEPIPEAPSGGISIGKIAASIIGLALLVALGVFIKRRRDKKREDDELNI